MRLAIRPRNLEALGRLAQFLLLRRIHLHQRIDVRIAQELIQQLLPHRHVCALLFCQIGMGAIIPRLLAIGLNPRPVYIPGRGRPLPDGLALRVIQPAMRPIQIYRGPPQRIHTEATVITVIAPAGRRPIGRNVRASHQRRLLLRRELITFLITQHVPQQIQLVGFLD